MYLYAIPWTGDYKLLSVYSIGSRIRIGHICGDLVGYSSSTNLVYIESETHPDEVGGFIEYFIKKVCRME